MQPRPRTTVLVGGNYMLQALNAQVIMAALHADLLKSGAVQIGPDVFMTDLSKGHQLVGADYGAIEARIMSHEMFPKSRALIASEIKKSRRQRRRDRGKRK